MAEVEFSVPLKARVLLTYGNSSDPNSPHYGDQLALLAKKDWREVWRARSELAQHVEERTVLNTDERK
jgi:acyl-homoserine-lactone acylase